jgi:maltooligosyltrehalose synthase
MWVLVVVPRLLTKLVDTKAFPLGRQVWGDDTLLLPDDTPESWFNTFTGENLKVSNIRRELPISEILRTFPVALLIGS